MKMESKALPRSVPHGRPNEPITTATESTDPGTQQSCTAICYSRLLPHVHIDDDQDHCSAEVVLTNVSSFCSPERNRVGPSGAE